MSGPALKFHVSEELKNTILSLHDSGKSVRYIKQSTVAPGGAILRILKKNGRSRDTKKKCGKTCPLCHSYKDYSEYQSYLSKGNQTRFATRCRECDKSYQSEYRLLKKEDNKKYQKNYRTKNKSKAKDYMRSYVYNRSITDISFFIKRKISTRLRDTFKIRSIKKEYSYSKNIERIVGWKLEEFKTHIESLFECWMSWKNWGKYNPDKWKDDDSSTWVWNLDHIKPQSEFTFSSFDSAEIKECWALSNLRPLSAKQNIIDGCTRIRHTRKIK